MCDTRKATEHPLRCTWSVSLALFLCIPLKVAAWFSCIATLPYTAANSGAFRAMVAAGFHLTGRPGMHEQHQGKLPYGQLPLHHSL